jgi:hypothetical protein
LLLKRGYSRATVRKNIREMIGTDTRHTKAVAAAYSSVRADAKRKRARPGWLFKRRYNYTAQIFPCANPRG